MTEIALPDGRTLTLTGNETPEQINALKTKLKEKYGTQPDGQKKETKKTARGTMGLAAKAAEGASFGFAPKIASGIGALGAYLPAQAIAAATGSQAPTLGGLYDIGMKQYGGLGKEAEAQYPVFSTVAEMGGALGTGLGAAGTAPARALGNLASRGGLFGRTAVGAGAGEASQRLYEAGTGESGKELEALGRKGISLGGMLGGAIPVGGAAMRWAGRALTPAVKESARRSLDLAKKYDIPLGIDDLTDSPFYQHLIQKGSSLPLAGGTSSAVDQLKALTKAVAKSIGLDDVDSLTPQAMDEAFVKAGGTFDELTKGKTFTITDDALDTLSSIDEAVQGGAYGEAGINLFKKYTDDIFIRIKTDALEGNDLVKLRNRFSRISRTGANPEAKTLAKDMENFLVDLIGEDAPEQIKNAKYIYKNLIVVEPLAQKVQADGIISPALLTNRVRSVYGRQFTRGKAGELGDLAMLGQVIKQKVPDSGTPIGNLILGAATGGSVPLAFLSPPAAAVQAGTTGLGLLANRAIQKRNVNPAAIEKLMSRGGKSVVYNPVQTGLPVGASMGVLGQ